MASATGGYAPWPRMMRGQVETSIAAQMPASALRSPRNAPWRRADSIGSASYPAATARMTHSDGNATATSETADPASPATLRPT